MIFRCDLIEFIKMVMVLRNWTIILLCWYMVHGSEAKTPNIIQKDLLPLKCIASINNKQVLKEIGSVWNTDDPCIKQTCTTDENHLPIIRSVQEYCSVKCQDDYEKVIEPGECCGKCVKTRCKLDGKLYKVGETWRSNDTCLIYSCENHAGVVSISNFKKSCPPLTPECAGGDVYIEDCCPKCRHVPQPDRFDFLEENLYEIHPCKRKCIKGEQPKICMYHFTIEWYQTMSKACFDCPYNTTDCFRPHCIVGDGASRSVEVINRRMPGPPIEVCLGDTIVVDVENELLGESTTIHWHGLHQRESPYMDGVPHVSQCPIPPHTTFRYHFKADHAGTHFWHSHTGMQRGDGSFGALIIRKPQEMDAHGELYDYDLSEHTILIQDWAHIPGVSLFASHHHARGSNKPPNILINGIGRYFPRELKEAVVLRLFEGRNNDEHETDRTQPTLNPTSIVIERKHIEVNDTSTPSEEIQDILKVKNEIEKSANESAIFPLAKFKVTKGNRYRFRIINAEFLNCPVAVSIDNHTLKVINSDGYDIEPVEVASLVTYAGERFDFVVNANRKVGNYWIRFKGLMDCDQRFTSAHQAAILHYNGADDSEPAGTPSYDHVTEGLELNSLNKGPGHNDTITIPELVSMEEEESWVHQDIPDYKFFVYYDFYRKDNPHFHVPNMYGFNQTKAKLFTPQLNHISMKMPPLPLLQSRYDIDESLFCNASSLAAKGIDCTKEFCECSHVLKVSLGAVVEMVLVDEGRAYDANHPFHLHGNAFRVVGMDRVGQNVGVEEIRDMDEEGVLKRNFKNAPIKDTVTIPDGGYTIIRFKADNPGFWLFHCHIEFHAEIGMALVLKVGENDEMMSAPKDFPTCYNYMPKIRMSDGRSAAVRTSYNMQLISYVLLMFLGLSELLL